MVICDVCIVYYGSNLGRLPGHRENCIPLDRLFDVGDNYYLYVREQILPIGNFFLQKKMDRRGTCDARQFQIYKKTSGSDFDPRRYSHISLICRVGVPRIKI